MVSQGDCTAVLFREMGVFRVDGRGYRARASQWFTFADARIRKMDQVVAITAAG